MKTLAPLLFLLLLGAGCRRPTESPFPPPDQLPALQARLSADTARIGDVLDLTLRISAESPLLLPDPLDWLDPRVRILERVSLETPPAESGWIEERLLRVAVYEIADLELFAAESIETLDDPPQTLPLPFLSLSIEPLTGEDDTVPNFGNLDLMDFRGSEALRRARRNLLLSLIGALVLIAFLVMVWRRSGLQPPLPPPPPRWDQIALRRMAELRQKDIWISGDADASAVALSAILREFIEGRFHIHAPDLTTEEFLQEAAARQPWPDEDQQELTAFFTAVDRIKFAAERPGPEALQALMQAAERFVRVTGPQTEVSA